MREALLELRSCADGDIDSTVFGYKNAPKTANMAALKDANIEDFTWHDGRHTATTRMMEATNKGDLVKKITGHTQHSTFERYYNPSTDAIVSVAEALAERNEKQMELMNSAVTSRT